MSVETARLLEQRIEEATDIETLRRVGDGLNPADLTSEEHRIVNAKWNAKAAQIHRAASPEKLKTFDGGPNAV